MTFHVGQRIICVDASLLRQYAPWKARPSDTLDGLMQDARYTVRAIGEYSGEPSVWLAEINRTILPRWEHFGEPGFSPQRFRPLTEKSTDAGMEILRKLQDPINHKILERT